MADFSPQVFYALAMTADRDRKNSLKTQYNLDEVGFPMFNEVTDNNTADDLEELKNGIFKLIMLRAAENLYSDRSRSKGKKECTVKLEITFGDGTFHAPPEKKKNTLLGGGNQVKPEEFDTAEINDLIALVYSKNAICNTKTTIDSAMSKLDPYGSYEKYGDFKI